MKKRFDRYFEKNIARKLYVVSIALIAVGAVIGYFYWWRYGMPLMVIGVVGFFVTSGIQLSDKDVDQQVQSSVEELRQEIDGKQHGKETLDARDFSFFCGFVRTDAKTRFVVGRDGRVRTSRYYVTAISTKPKNATVFSAVYDLLSPETPTVDQAFASYAQGVELSVEELDFPAGNKKCLLTTGDDPSNKQSVVFFLPNDALAEKHLETIVSVGKNGN